MTRIGDYEVEDEIGRGGAGRVLRARHAPTGAVRALKVLEGAADPVAVERFRREAQALARVGPDVAVTVHEAGSDRGHIFYVMDLMPGGSLEARTKGEKLGWRDGATLVARLARSVARCHAVRIVHRDLKPANVLFDENAEPRLADFGCARDLRQSALTETGTVIGTPAYMAPEQLDGRHAGSPADVYALGAILHELIAGAVPHPFKSWLDLLQRAQKGLEKPVAAAAGAPAALDRILAAALAPAPGDRPSASALAKDLDALVAGKLGGGRPRLFAVVLTLVVLGLAAVAAAKLWTRGPAPVAARSETDAERLARIRSGDARRGDLEWLAASPKGSIELHGLALNAVIIPLDAVASPESSKDLRTIAALAHAARATDPVERRRWLEPLKRGRPGGETELFVGAALGVLDELDRELGTLELRPNGEEFDGILRTIARRPDLLGIAIAPLASACRMDLLAHCQLASERGISLRKVDGLDDALELAPPEVAANYVIKADSFVGDAGREPGWTKGNARRRAAALERQAVRLEAKGDRVLAFLVRLNGAANETPTNEWAGTPYERSTFGRHVARAHELLEELRTDAELAPSITALEWELSDNVSRGMFYWFSAREPAEDRAYIARTLDEVNRALARRAGARSRVAAAEEAGRAAALLIALGRQDEVASLPDLDPDDPLRVLAASPLDPDALERTAERGSLDHRLLVKGGALSIAVGIDLAHDRRDEKRITALSGLNYVPMHLVLRTTDRLVRERLRK